MKIAIVSNGSLGDKDFHLSVLADADMVICADGGANNAHSLGIIPDYVIGDMDSIRKDVLDALQGNDKTRIIVDPDQDKTDTELAIALAESFDPEEIIMLCALGSRIDHTMANILCLDRIKEGISARIVDDRNELVLVDSSLDIRGTKGQVVSVIPLTDVSGLTYEGLKWPLKNESFKFNWIGVCNMLVGSKARVSLDKGKVLVIRSRD